MHVSFTGVEEELTHPNLNARLYLGHILRVD